jgi:hypothetical protein
MSDNATPRPAALIEFSAEHLPEVAMDNRFATLPLWTGDTTRRQSRQFTAALTR